MPCAMELVLWEPFLSEEEQQLWLSLEPKGWAAASSKYPLALPALTVGAEGATVHADCFWWRESLPWLLPTPLAFLKLLPPEREQANKARW